MNDMNTIKAHERFLAVLGSCGNITHACKLAKAGRTALYGRRKVDEEFARAWDEALEMGVGALEDEAMSRAFDRNDKSSHLLLMFMLKSLRPEKYRDTYKPDKDKEGAKNFAEMMKNIQAELDQEETMEQLIQTAGYVKAIEVESRPTQFPGVVVIPTTTEA